MKEAILVERDFKGIYERFALTPEEFSEKFPETYEKFGPFNGVVNTLGKGGELSSFEYSDSDTLRPMVHIWFCPTDIGSDLWKTFFTDMEWGLPESDIESGNLAYIREDFIQSLKEFLPQNTKINFLYRDAHNYKIYNEVIISGTLTEKQKQEIRDTLNDELWFIPAKVGFPANRFNSFDPEVDHYWFELLDDADAFETTVCLPTVEYTADEVVQAFIKCKNNWELGIDEHGNLLNSEKPSIAAQIASAEARIISGSKSIRESEIEI